MDKKIVGYHQDEVADWVADLECGHCQHLRHDPPWTNRPWVTTAKGRASALGDRLDCKECDAGSSKALGESGSNEAQKRS